MRNLILSKQINWPTLLVPLILVALAGCGGKLASGSQSAPEQRLVREAAPNKAEVPPEPPVPVHDPLDGRAYDYYVNGLLYEQLGDHKRAAQSFALACTRDTTSRELAYAYARATFMLRDVAKAASIMEKAESDDPEHLRLLGRCYHELGQSDKVRSTYLRLIRIDPDDVMAYSFLASVYRRQQEMDSTIWAYRNLSRLRPSNTRFMGELGSLLVASGRLPEARDIYRRSLDVDFSADNIGALFSLGELYQRDQMNDSAVNVYERGIEIVPNNVVLLSQLAMLWVRMDSLQAALPHATKIVELSPQDTDAIRRLGILYYALDSLGAADSVISSLVEGGQSHPTNHFYLGRIAALQDDWYRARDEFLQLVELADTSSASWLDLGQAYRRLDQPREEIDCYRRGLSHMRTEAEAINIYFALGAAYEQNQQYDSAESTFEDLLSNNPSHAPALNYLGYMLADRGERLDEAEVMIAKALEIDPNNPAYLDSYGWVLYRLEQFDEAVPYLERAAELNVDSIVFDHLGDAYRAVGQVGLAREWWGKALDADPDNEEIIQKLRP